jgi:YD repeat-containing protein
MTHIDGTALSWDNTGNLLEDHEATEYAYDTANRLIRVIAEQDGVTYTFAYNGTGDRLSQSVGGAVTTYSLDIYGGLTQVLGDGASVYLYGLGRVGEEGAAGWLYHKGEIAGSLGLGSFSAVIDWFEQGGCQSCGSDFRRWAFLRLLLDADYGDTISGITLDMFGQQGEIRLRRFGPLPGGCGIAASGNARVRTLLQRRPDLSDLDHVTGTGVPNWRIAVHRYQPGRPSPGWPGNTRGHPLLPQKPPATR